MYLLRTPVAKLCISKAIPSGCVNLNSPAVCPSCRLLQVSLTVAQIYRRQSTNTKAIIVRSVKKKKAKIEQYSELIQEASESNIKASRAVIKKYSMSDILKNLGPGQLKKLRKQALPTVSPSNETSTAAKTDLLKRNCSPETSLTPLLSKYTKSASKSTPSKRATVTKTNKNLSKKARSLLKDSNAERKKTQLKSVQLLNQNGACSDKLEDSAVVNEFSVIPSYNEENIGIRNLESIDHVSSDDRAILDSKQAEPDIDKVEDFPKSASSKNTKLNKMTSLPKRSSSLKARDREKASKIKAKELDNSGKDLHLNLSMAAYLDVCVNSDMLSLAHSTLMYHQKKGRYQKDVQKLTNVRLLNIVLSGHAQKQNNWSKFREILSLIDNKNIKPNLQTYAACLECISRLPTKDKEIIHFVIENAEKYGLYFANLDRECTFFNDQRERVIEMVRLVHPDFHPAPKENLKRYSCNLLSRLNEEPLKGRFYDPTGGTVTYEQLTSNLRHQLETEIANKVEVRSIEKVADKEGENLEKTRSILRECEKNWREALYRAFKENIANINSHEVSKYGKSVTLHPFLMTLDAEVYVDIMLQEIQLLGESSETYSRSLSTLHFIIGSKVMNTYMIARKQKHGLVSKIESLYQKYCEYYVNPKLTTLYTPREYWQKLVDENMDGPTIDIDDETWPGYLVSGVGKFLYDIIIQEVKINTKSTLKSEVIQRWQTPAFYMVYRHSGVYLKEEIKPHPMLVQMYQSGIKETITFEGTVLPSLVPPLPWTSINNGGYLLSSAKIVRLPESSTYQRAQLEKTPNQQLFPIYDSLNQLGECPWKINKPILDIIIEIFNNKGDEVLAIPPPPSEYPSLPSISSDMSKEERAKTFKERALLQNKRSEMHSLRCDSLYKLSIANHFRDKVFWFPHNMDFRGRVYPCPPHFNHLGGDITRSILLFAKGDPLGEKGLDWLKIHLVNLTGLKKQEAISKRLEFANEIIPEIMDCADNPLNGRRWWTKVDEPWQTLACCKEITNAIRFPDPTKYICHFPVHQDGTCNGLQHYAALGRDENGAKEVNLYPLEKPQDVYNGVVNLVEKQRAKDAEVGVKIAQVLEGFIKRKVIKQTIMTTVYGVTRYGARHQIKKQLMDLSDFPEEHIWEASMYLTKQTFETLQQMFTATKTIQDWLTEVAQQISQVCGQPVEWISPLGLPIVQPYHKPAKTTTLLGIGKKHQTRKHYKMDIFLRPDVAKQKNAFPPNFIHSLDSAHMMLTSLFCQREGITFVSVHDCYWTHPSKSIQTMNKICREQFVALHSEPILENLSKFLMEKYSYCQDDFENDTSVVGMSKRRLNKLVQNVPSIGNFDLTNVLKSTYFFS